MITGRKKRMAEVTAPRVNLWTGMLGITITIISVLVGVGVTAGSYAADLSEAKQKIDSLEKQVVTKEEFRELKSDVKEIKKEIFEIGKAARK